MFNLKLLDDEEIKLVENDVLLKTNNDYLNITIVITNKRLLMLDYPKGLDALKFGKMINYPRYLEVIFECDLNDINNVLEEDEFDKYILNDERYFYLNSDEIRKYLSNYNIN